MAKICIFFLRILTTFRWFCWGGDGPSGYSTTESSPCSTRVQSYRAKSNKASTLTVLPNQLLTSCGRNLEELAPSNGAGDVCFDLALLQPTHQCALGSVSQRYWSTSNGLAELPSQFRPGCHISTTISISKRRKCAERQQPPAAQEIRTKSD